MSISPNAVEAAAPDQASLKAAAGLAAPGRWTGRPASSDGRLIWGACQGSGASPCRVVADLTDLGAKSRKFPCKHALALMMLQARSAGEFAPGEVPGWVSDRLGRRRGGGAPKAAAGGTDIDRAVAWCEERIGQPAKIHLILIAGLMEGGDARAPVARLARLAGQGANVIVLLSLTDTGAPWHDAAMAGRVAAPGIPVFACAPGQFPDLTVTALRREDIQTRAAREDIKTVRPAGPE